MTVEFLIYLFDGESIFDSLQTGIIAVTYSNEESPVWFFWANEVCVTPEIAESSLGSMKLCVNQAEPETS